MSKRAFLSAVLDVASEESKNGLSQNHKLLVTLKRDWLQKYQEEIIRS